MNVLDPFIHDPLMEWIERRRREKGGQQNNNTNPLSSMANLRELSLHALGPIGEKLDGKFKPCKSRAPPRHLSVTNHVQALISEATDIRNLVSRAYII